MKAFLRRMMLAAALGEVILEAWELGKLAATILTNYDKPPAPRVQVAVVDPAGDVFHFHVGSDLQWCALCTRPASHSIHLGDADAAE